MFEEFRCEICVCGLSRSVTSDSLQPCGCGPPGSSVHGDSPGKKTGVGCIALLQGIFPTHGLDPNPGTERRFPVLQAYSLQSEPPGKL